MIPAHYLVELDQVGCPDPMPRYRRFFEPAIATGPGGRGGGWRRIRARGVRGADGVDGGGAGRRADRRRVLGRRGQHVGVAAGAAGRGRARPQSRRRARVHPRLRRRRRRRAGRRRGGARWGSRRTWERVDVPESAVRPARGDPHHRGLPSARRGVRGRVALPAARHPRALSVAALSRGRRRRRREPEGLSARGLRPDAVEHPAQPAALPGRLGHRRHQAQPGLLGRPVARLRPDLRAGGALRLHGVLALRRPRRRSPRRRRCRSRACSAASPSG